MSDHGAALLFQGKVQMGCRRGKMGLCSHFFGGKLRFLFQVGIALSNPSLYQLPAHPRTAGIHPRRFCLLNPHKQGKTSNF